MKKRLFLVFALIALLLCGCHQEKGGNEDFTQKELPTPSQIEIRTNNIYTSYDPETEEYAKIWDALRPNWWKTAAETPETAADEALFLAESPAQLKTTSNRTYAESGDTFVCFLYKDTPLKWVEPNGKTTLDIEMVAFWMPPMTESEETVKGCFLISEGTDIGINEGLFTYYYPPEIAAGFWNWLTDN